MQNKQPGILRQLPWLAICAILLTGAAISLGILFFRGQSAGPRHELVFLDADGSVLEKQRIPDGSYAVPPELDSENDAIVFRSWNQSLYQVSLSTQLEPVFQDLNGLKNAFYLDSCYAEPGDKVTMKLYLGADVCLSAVDLTLRYDPAILQELRCDTGSGPFQVTQTADGTVSLRLEEAENLTEGVTAATLRFTVSPDWTEPVRTSIRIAMESPRRIADGLESGTDSNAVHGDIYILS